MPKQTRPETFNADYLIGTLGFTREARSRKTFNVICITRYANDDSDLRGIYHCDPMGIKGGESQPVEITVTDWVYTRSDITFSQTVVCYCGGEYLLDGVRNGLSGRALVLNIRNLADEQHNVWALYTDTPSGRPDRLAEVITPEMLRDEAKTAMSWT